MTFENYLKFYEDCLRKVIRFFQFPRNVPSYLFNNPSKFFSALQSFCCRLSVGLLSYDNRSTLKRLHQRIKFGREMRLNKQTKLKYVSSIWSPCDSFHCNKNISQRHPSPKIQVCNMLTRFYILMKRMLLKVQ